MTLSEVTYLLTRDDNGQRALWPGDAKPTYSHGMWNCEGGAKYIADDDPTSCDTEPVSKYIGEGNYGVLSGDSGLVKVTTTVERV